MSEEYYDQKLKAFLGSVLQANGYQDASVKALDYYADSVKKYVKAIGLSAKTVKEGGKRCEGSLVDIISVMPSHVKKYEGNVQDYVLKIKSEFDKNDNRLKNCLKQGKESSNSGRKIYSEIDNMTGTLAPAIKLTAQKYNDPQSEAKKDSLKFVPNYEPSFPFAYTYNATPHEMKEIDGHLDDVMLLNEANFKLTDAYTIDYEKQFPPDYSVSKMVYEENDIDNDICSENVTPPPISSDYCQFGMPVNPNYRRCCSPIHRFETNREWISDKKINEIINYTHFDKIESRTGSGTTKKNSKGVRKSGAGAGDSTAATLPGSSGTGLQQAGTASTTISPTAGDGLQNGEAKMEDEEEEEEEEGVALHDEENEEGEDKGEGEGEEEEEEEGEEGEEDVDDDDDDDDDDIDDDDEGTTKASGFSDDNEDTDVNMGGEKTDDDAEIMDDDSRNDDDGDGDGDDNGWGDGDDDEDTGDDMDDG